MIKKKNTKVYLTVGLAILAVCFVLACLITLAILYFRSAEPVQEVVTLEQETQETGPTVEQETQEIVPSINLQGIWQQNNSMAAGWTDRYHFYPSGTFHFYPNEMTCIDEKVQKIGSWALQNDILTLTTTKQVVTSFEVLATGLCNMIEKKEVDLVEPVIEQFTVVDLGTVGDDFYPSITINGVQYWKFNDDASSYGDEEFPE